MLDIEVGKKFGERQERINNKFAKVVLETNPHQQSVEELVQQKVKLVFILREYLSLYNEVRDYWESNLPPLVAQALGTPMLKEFAGDRIFLARKAVVAIRKIISERCS